MEIELKNGEKIILEVTSLILEYLEDYKGGIAQLRRDAQGEKDENGYTKTMYAVNQFIYAVIASSYYKQITYRQAVRLVKLEDIEKIAEFVIKNIPECAETESDSISHFHKM